MDCLDALPDGPVCADGVWPLYSTDELADAASPLNTSHAHAVGAYSVYMPNGLSGANMIHGGPCPEGSVDASAVFTLPLTAFCVACNFPLYTNRDAAVAASPFGMAHGMTFEDKSGSTYTFYMPNGAAGAVMGACTCPSGSDDRSTALAVPFHLDPAPSPPPPGSTSPGGVAGIVVGTVFGIATLVAASTWYKGRKAAKAKYEAAARKSAPDLNAPGGSKV